MTYPLIWGLPWELLRPRNVRNEEEGGALSGKPETPSGGPSDVIAVRDGESFDPGPLAEYLKGRLEGGDGTLEVLQFPGGHANLTYLLKIGRASCMERVFITV